MSGIKSPAPAKTTDSQPSAALPMSMMTAPPSTGGNNRSQQGECEHQRASRLRGGGAGKDCFISLIACFLCCECCEGCCDCIADIVCCPCEMCC
ncbi:hypothetical protein AMATHDRAFT_59529 [Amanita thiersii Skay4041]|uniref:Cysteine-rich transmembrane CYSTM domain-containing protein n=1 Tax=Amanita thiersii Skay4041 TaxID=703135 RepID=A0A2A9NTY7_9AGAR|nr:hypothetical protein AMATHDRAFT_59529 [Amanita thiersii Skay4041]